MFLRKPLEVTLPEIRERLDEKGDTVSALSSEISINVDGDSPSIRIKEREVPLTASGIAALGARYEVPTKFLGRIDVDLSAHILNTLMGRNDMTNAVKLNDDGVIEVRDTGTAQVDLRRIVDVASKVISPDAQVVNFWKEPGREFRLDVVVPTDFDRGWGGDRQVNDLTGAGLRFTQNLKQSDQFHSPAVSLILYRLACTNGYESADETEKVDARGSTLEDVMIEYEALADRLFRRAEEKIGAFYAMRQTQIEEPEQRILRLASEFEIPNRITVDMVARVPEFINEGNSTFTEFDLVNLLTNQANDPRITRDGPRRTLQRLGGHLIGDHEARCNHCQSKLTH